MKKDEKKMLKTIRQRAAKGLPFEEQLIIAYRIGQSDAYDAIAKRQSKNRAEYAKKINAEHGWV